MSRHRPLLSALLGFLGCADKPSAVSIPAVHDDEEHNRLYREGCTLVGPYFKLHDVRSIPADTRKAREDLHRGIAMLRRVVEYRPDNWPAFWTLGKAWQAIGDSGQACDAFGKSFAIQKSNPDVAREYMVECFNLGRADEGLRVAEHAVGLNPNDAGLVANLALASLIAGRLEEAIRAVEKSLNMAPEDEITRDLQKKIFAVRDGKRPCPRTIRELEGA